MHILILSASVGAGHLRAAQAAELAFRELAPDAVVENIDVLTLTNTAFRRVYGKAYIDLVNKAPHLLGYLYDLMDQPRSPQRKSDRLRLAWQQLNLTKLTRFLHATPWDAIVNTHFLPAEIVASLRRKHVLNAPHFTVTTDFETHRLWVQDPCEHYFTATEEGALNLQHWGVPATATSATGIPIHPVFAEPTDRAACLQRQGLRGDRPIILQLAGGFGIGPVEKLCTALLDIEVPAEIVVVAGRNEDLRKRLTALTKRATGTSKDAAIGRHLVKVLGFTDQIDELMLVADLIVTKPGGLTTSEALARGAALAVVNPVPGQESRNSDFLLENGAAVKINNLATLPWKLTALLRDPQRLTQLKSNARQLGRPRAAFDVARKVLGELGIPANDPA